MHGHFWGRGCEPKAFAFGGRSGGWWGFDPTGGAYWAGGRGPRGRGRVFEQGDLKYVILRLLDEKPRHGYEVIKELEDRFAGAYSPSPGTVYPTLSMLEDLGYARAIPDEGGRKVYEITDSGRAYLAENKDTVEDIFERIARFGSGFFGDAMREVHASFADVAKLTYGTVSRHASDTTVAKRIADILKETAAKLQELAREAEGKR